MIYRRDCSICKLSDMRDSHSLLSGKGSLIQMNWWGEKNGCQRKGITVGELGVGQGHEGENQTTEARIEKQTLDLRLECRSKDSVLNR